SGLFAQGLTETDFSVGTVFQSVQEAREAIKRYARQKKRGIYWEHNDAERLDARCKSMEGRPWPEKGAEHPIDGCPFRIFARGPRGCRFQVREACLQHLTRCTVNAGRVRRTEVKEIARAVMPYGDLRPHGLRNLVQEHLGTSCSYNTSNTSINEVNAEDALAGDKGFQYMRSILQVFKRENPTSVVSMRRKGNMFWRAGMTFPGARTAALNCLPIVFVDGCHNKGRWGGCTLNAVLLDCEHKLVRMGSAWVEGENGDACGYFLQLLLEAVPELNSPNFTLMHDRGKAWKAARLLMMPLIRESFCITHITRNFNSKFGSTVDGKIELAAFALTPDVYRGMMDKVEEECPGGKEYLEKEGLSQKWAASRFGAPRYGCYSSNPVESHHATMRSVRRQNPAQVLLSFIQKEAIALCEMGKTYGQLNEADFPTKTSAIITENREKGTSYRAEQTGPFDPSNGHRISYKVTRRSGNEQRRVRIDLQEPKKSVCSCNYTR
ncbi:unnamed protein product, partial [Closterium sp. Yama58-4]